MRILISTTGLSSVGSRGGISSYVTTLANNLSNSNYEVFVYLITQKEYKVEDIFSYKVICWRIPCNRADEGEFSLNLFNHVEKLNPDVIINNDVSYFSGFWPYLKSSIIKISIMHAFTRGFSLTNAGIQAKIAVYNNKFIDYIVFQNSQMKSAAAKKYKLDVDKLVTIYQTTDIFQSTFQNQGVFTIVFAGGQNKMKGAKEMFEIAQKLKRTTWDFKLYWCLNASKYIDSFKDDKRFIFKEKLDSFAFKKLLAYSDCIIIPSHLDTGPLLLTEAFSVGCIPICNNLKYSAIPDLVVNGENGFIINHNNVNDFFLTIKKLYLKNDRSLLRKKCIEYFYDNLSPQIQVEKFEQMFLRKKNSLSSSLKYNAQNVIHFHNWDTSIYSIYSLKRILPKLLNSFEIVLTNRKYIFLKKIGL